MLVDSSKSTAGSAVTGAIRQASRPPVRASITSWRRRRSRSELNPQAGASTSSARGLFQFIDQTWLGTMKQAGAALGYGRYADAITQTASGHYRSAPIRRCARDPQAPQRSDRQRGDGGRVHAGKLGLERAARPRAQRGRALHCAFSRGGRRGEADPACRQQSQCEGRRIFSECRKGQPIDFYDRSTGAARSLAQVRNILTARYDIARGHQDYTAATAQADPAAPADAASGATAGCARQPRTPLVSPTLSQPPLPTPKADDTQVFHGLFADDHRTAPLAPVVSALWGTPKRPRRRRAGSEIPFRRHARSLQRPAAHKLLDQPMDSTLQRLQVNDVLNERSLSLFDLLTRAARANP